MNRYRCRLEWHDEDDATTIEADGPFKAAEQYVEDHNTSACEYPPDRTVFVKVDGKWRKFEVLLHMVPEYEAREFGPDGRLMRRGAGV